MRDKLDAFIASMRVERLSEKTIETYGLAVRLFLDDHGELTQETYDLWKMHSAQYAPATVRMRMSALARFAEFVGVEIALGKKPKAHKEIPVATTAEQRDRLVAAMRSKAHKLAVLLMGELGLRVSEACSLKWDDVDLEQQTLVVVRKGGKHQVLPIMGDKLADALRTADRKGEFVLGGVDRNDVGAAIRRAAKNVGIDAHPHSLRHGWAVNACRRGVGVGPIQQMLGHSNIATTSRYLEGLQMGADELRKALQ